VRPVRFAGVEGSLFGSRQGMTSVVPQNAPTQKPTKLFLPLASTPHEEARPVTRDLSSRLPPQEGASGDLSAPLGGRTFVSDITAP
jgi:hypothetical protein